MALTTPAWLTQRDGAVKIGSDNTTHFLVFAGQPHYSLTPVPAQGKFTCVVRQTENGRRFESPGLHDSAEAAIKGGLDDLGKELGWL